MHILSVYGELLIPEICLSSNLSFMSSENEFLISIDTLGLLQMWYDIIKQGFKKT